MKLNLCGCVTAGVVRNLMGGFHSRRGATSELGTLGWSADFLRPDIRPLSIGDRPQKSRQHQQDRRQAQQTTTGMDISALDPMLRSSNGGSGSGNGSTSTSSNGPGNTPAPVHGAPSAQPPASSLNAQRHHDRLPQLQAHHPQQQHQLRPQQQQWQPPHHHQPQIPHTNHPTSAFSPQTPASTATVNTSSTPANTTAPSSIAVNTPNNSYHHHNSPGDEHHSPGGAGGGLDPKKPRACESCRGLKVRCDPDPADPDGPCKRCAKAKRECVITQPTRKRAKKTDSRVAELEKKIDMLTASLQATRPQTSGTSTGGLHGPGSDPQAHQAAQALVSSADWRGTSHDQSGGRPGTDYGRYAGGGERYGQQQSMSTSLPPLSSTISSSTPAVAGQKRKMTQVTGEEERAAVALAGANFKSEDGAAKVADVVDRGILTMNMAEEFFMRYTQQMCYHLPGVVFPAGVTVGEVRANKPILFLSLMAAASAEIPSLQKTLTKELMQVFAEKIIVDGHKSLELVQALQVAVIWYWPPDRFEELKFYQLVHVAAVMAIEIGLGTKKMSRGGFKRHVSQAWRDHPMRGTPLDPTTLEARRAWLTCYFLATNTAMALHRANLIRWTPFMAECIDVLESSPEAVPTDKYFCHLVWTHKLAEEVGIQFSMDDPSSTPNIADSRTQYALKGFERELERYSENIPRELQQRKSTMSFHVISLYMHEIATHSDCPDDCRLGPNPDTPLASDAPLTQAHINALSACLTAIDGIFDTFLSLDVHTTRCLPVFNFVRVAYAVVVLIKLYFAASSTKSELGKVINKDHMKVEQHLDKLLEKFRATAAEDRSRPAAKFLLVLVMLRSWFQKQKQNQSGTGSNGSNTASDTPQSSLQTPSYPGPSGTDSKHPNVPTPVPSQTPQPTYPPVASTPLQLLSEMAAASANGASSRPNNDQGILPPSSSSSSGAMQQNWGNYPPPQQQQQPDTSNAFDIPGMGNPAWMLNNTFFPGDTFDFPGLGDGFAQAMDMTLGGFMDGTLTTAEDGVLRYEQPGTGGQQQQWYGGGDLMSGAVAGGAGGGGGGPAGGGYGF
uniref:Zn(2)-C6 fungal-type domain-containing protein n=1 Tax=Podospora anserina (strain S / ATCC MYA-4624 / DSM 980 / FGSC 10383) TaxID=515849 RepID=A0A090C948_PODAN|nr:Putative protein of unknown function [Podospora anserina S mat+]